MILSVHQPQYIPWLGYFDKIDKSDCFVFLDEVQYKQREFQNRNKIHTKDGELWLTVPVVSKDQGLQSIRDTKIDNSVDWKKNHLGSVRSWYGKAPYFDQYIGFFESVYNADWDGLCELNVHIIKYLLKCLQIDTPLYLESEIGTSTTSTDRIIEICNKMKSNTYLSGAGGKDYMDESKFDEAGIGLQYQEFIHPEYSQMFKAEDKSFTSYLSVIDLLFNAGEQSLEIIRGK